MYVSRSAAPLILLATLAGATPDDDLEPQEAAEARRQVFEAACRKGGDPRALRPLLCQPARREEALPMFRNLGLRGLDAALSFSPRGSCRTGAEAIRNAAIAASVCGLAPAQVARALRRAIPRTGKARLPTARGYARLTAITQACPHDGAVSAGVVRVLSPALRVAAEVPRALEVLRHARAATGELTQEIEALLQRQVKAAAGPTPPDLARTLEVIQATSVTSPAFVTPLLVIAQRSDGPRRVALELLADTRSAPFREEALEEAPGVLAAVAEQAAAECDGETLAALTGALEGMGWVKGEGGVYRALGPTLPALERALGACPATPALRQAVSTAAGIAPRLAAACAKWAFDGTLAVSDRLELAERCPQSPELELLRTRLEVKQAVEGLARRRVATSSAGSERRRVLILTNQCRQEARLQPANARELGLGESDSGNLDAASAFAVCTARYLCGPSPQETAKVRTTCCRDDAPWCAWMRTAGGPAP